MIPVELFVDIFLGLQIGQLMLFAFELLLQLLHLQLQLVGLPELRQLSLEDFFLEHIVLDEEVGILGD